MLLAALLLAFQKPATAPASDPSPAASSNAPRARGWDDFPVFVWREKYKGKPLPAELAEPFGGVILMRDEDSAWARERGLSYLIWNAAGRDALHLDADTAWNARVERWIQTHDEKLLVRTPCLNDPATLAQLDTTLDATLAKHGEHPGLGFVLGDEVSLTPNGDPFDLCRCPFCEAKWKEYAQKNGLPERAPLTDEVLGALAANDDAPLGAWLARRRFDREQVVETLAELIRRACAHATVVEEPCTLGFLGLKGRTAFGGFSPDELLDVARERGLPPFQALFEFYPEVGARESPVAGKRVATVFLKDESPDGSAWIAWDQFLRGGQGLVLWEDQDLETRPAQRKRLQEAVAAIRALEARFSRRGQLVFRDPGPTIALVRDGDAQAFNWLQDALADGSTWPRRKDSYQQSHGSLEKKTAAWLRCIEHGGLRASAIELPSLAQQESLRFPVWILPDLAILDDREVSVLVQYLDSGGYLVLDGPLGVRRRNGTLREQNVSELLHQREPERVISAQGGVDGRTPSPESDALLRHLVRNATTARKDWFEKIGVAIDGRGMPCTESVELEAEPPASWRSYGARMGSAELVAFLPTCATAEERRSELHPSKLHARPAAGYSLEWIHPADPETPLAAGDAAVFVVRPVDAPAKR